MHEFGQTAEQENQTSLVFHGQDILFDHSLEGHKVRSELRFPLKHQEENTAYVLRVDDGKLLYGSCETLWVLSHGFDLLCWALIGSLQDSQTKTEHILDVRVEGFIRDVLKDGLTQGREWL